jgi:NAD(P)-dependent dehydrogenase (short-subunit alcohol dehydrogenase family)
MLQMDHATWDKVQKVNLRGLAFACQAAGRYFVREQLPGRIVNIASVDSVHPSMAGLAAYDASKGGVLSFSKNFALEMAPHGVRVNVIEPGGVRTPGTALPLQGSGMTAEQMAAVMKGFVEAKIPMRRMGEPDEIANVAVFLASAASSYMTGSAVLVDGGMLLG